QAGQNSDGDQSAQAGGQGQAAQGGTQAAQTGQGGAGASANGGGFRRQAGQGGEQPGGASGGSGRGQGGGRADTAILWKYHTDTKQLEPVQVRTGITDHTFTEVISPIHGTLNVGDQLIVGSAGGGQRTAGGGPGGAGAPGGARAPGR